MLPHGTVIYNALIDMLREQYRARGYEEVCDRRPVMHQHNCAAAGLTDWHTHWQVMTPLIYKKELWETSGHLENYKEDMFMVSPGVPDEGTASDSIFEDVSSPTPNSAHPLVVHRHSPGRHW